MQLILLTLRYVCDCITYAISRNKLFLCLYSSCFITVAMHLLYLYHGCGQSDIAIISNLPGSYYFAGMSRIASEHPKMSWSPNPNPCIIILRLHLSICLSICVYVCMCTSRRWLEAIQPAWYRWTWVVVTGSPLHGYGTSCDSGVKTTVGHQPFSVHFRPMADHLPLFSAIWPAIRQSCSITAYYVLNINTYICMWRPLPRAIIIIVLTIITQSTA